MFPSGRFLPTVASLDASTARGYHEPRPLREMGPGESATSGRRSALLMTRTRLHDCDPDAIDETRVL